MVQADGPFERTPGEGFAPVDARIVSADTAVVAADRLAAPLVVRSRWPGDRVRPLGLGGRKKLQDVLTDRKVSRAMRDYVPIVTDAHGRIVWVAGHLIGEEFAVTDRTNAVIILKLRRI
jgi:tRNA(Ile)-lysidine synthase